jgi:hypothetical protein
MRPHSIESLRARALGLALGTVGLTALAALVFPVEASRLAPFALIMPFLSMGALEASVDASRRRPR